ncbi:MAG: SsrA-binding protein, partial [Candidatus Gastranaerophilaceae bacterium]
MSKIGVILRINIKSAILIMNNFWCKKLHPTGSKIKKDGYTVVPLEVFIDRGFAKIEIGLAKGKKLHD